MQSSHEGAGAAALGPTAPALHPATAACADSAAARTTTENHLEQRCV